MSKYDNAGLVMIPSGYKASKVYSVIPNTTDGDFDFSRGSTATRVNKDGLIEVVASNVPRLDYPLIDGVVQDCPSLLLEPQRTNLITYSEDFSQSAWVKTGLSVNSNQIISPDGTLNADEVNISAANSHYLFYSISVSALTNYTFTFYVKKGTATDVSYSILNETNFTNIVNTTSYFNEISDTNWTRISVEFTTPSGCTSIRVYTLRDGSSIGTVYIYGAQLEQGSYPTSYIPTSGSTVTRVAETCNGAGNADTFNDSEGVLFAEISALADDLTNKVISINDNSGSNVIRMGYAASSNEVNFIVRATTNIYSYSQVLGDITTLNKLSISYSSSGAKVFINGFLSDSGALSSLPNGLSQLDFRYGNGTLPFYGNTKQLMTFNKALTDAELEDLTSWDSFLEMATSQLYTIN